MTLSAPSGSISGITSTFESGYRAGEFAGVDAAQESVRQYAEKLRKRGLDSEARSVEKAAQTIWQDFNQKVRVPHDIKELDLEAVRRLI